MEPGLQPLNAPQIDNGSPADHRGSGECGLGRQGQASAPAALRRGLKRARRDSNPRPSALNADASCLSGSRAPWLWLGAGRRGARSVPFAELFNRRVLTMSQTKRKSVLETARELRAYGIGRSWIGSNDRLKATPLLPPRWEGGNFGWCSETDGNSSVCSPSSLWRTKRVTTTTGSIGLSPMPLRRAGWTEHRLTERRCTANPGCL